MDAFDLAEAYSMGCEDALDEFGTKDNPYDESEEKELFDEYEEGFASVGCENLP